MLEIPGLAPNIAVPRLKREESSADTDLSSVMVGLGSRALKIESHLIKVAVIFSF